MTSCQGFAGSPSLHIAIVGAGLGGLTCAIACRQANKALQVTVIERTPEILALGAGIHIPPNACRALIRFGLLDKLKKAGGYQVGNFTLRGYQDGQVIVEKPLKGRVEMEYEAEWIAIHRGDYQDVLLAEALRAGVTVMVHAEVVGVEASRESQQTLILKDGRRIEADVVIGADGLWSLLRDIVCGKRSPPEETGDLAYRGTFSRSQLLGLKNDRLRKILEQSDIQVWLGPGRHAVFYPLRNHTEYNLVLIVADDLPEGVRTSPGTPEEMASHFKDWDPLLGPIALLGDASHPTLPYQGQGAAMAVEDGAILGLLLAKSWEAGLPASQEDKNAYIASLFQLYQDLRKQRTEVNVAGAVHTRHYYHLADGDEQLQRDKELAGLPATGWQGKCSFNWGDAEYQKSLLGFDIFPHTEAAFDSWLKRSRETVAKN
ncbi:FAD/NAD(P)-binding domain-containing protein [Thozetella sp. PMI_491]|nr:FAD/NAD(P)-binding domain-containing protein [Thozetella sp. PMI_491]